ncbi:uncharacterized protein LOC144152165 isoform X2 [Haemaphysalis longicornis]
MSIRRCNGGTCTLLISVLNHLLTIEKFPNTTAIYAVTATLGDADLHCVVAELTQYDSAKGTAAYTWHMKNGGTLVQNIKKGNTPYEVKVITSTDPFNEWTAIYPYTDNKICFVLKAEDVEGVCGLWASNDYVTQVSTECIEEFQKICGEGVLLYDKNNCA